MAEIVSRCGEDVGDRTVFEQAEEASIINRARISWIKDHDGGKYGFAVEGVPSWMLAEWRLSEER